MINKHLGKNDIQVGAWHKCNGNVTYNNRFFRDVAGGLWRLNKHDIRSVLTSILKGDFKLAMNRVACEYYPFKMPPHPTAKEIKRSFPEEWDKYYKFCAVRNPYEKVVSDYIWRK